MTILLIIVICLFLLSIVSVFMVEERRSKHTPSFDPLEAEARRLAEQDLAEWEWKMGLGPEPTHLIKREQAAAIVPILLKRIEPPTEEAVMKHVRQWMVGEPPPPPQPAWVEVKNGCGDVVYRYQT